MARNTALASPIFMCDEIDRDTIHERRARLTAVTRHWTQHVYSLHPTWHERAFICTPRTARPPREPRAARTSRNAARPIWRGARHTAGEGNKSGGVARAGGARVGHGDLGVGQIDVARAPRTPVALRGARHLFARGIEVRFACQPDSLVEIGRQQAPSKEFREL